MKVSIIISAHKDRGFLDECILSAKNQTFKDYEIILSSDGNPDLMFCAEKHGINFIITPKSNHSTALNHAMIHAQGDWIKEIHDDDLLMPDCLTDLYKWKGDCDLIYANAINFSGKNESIYRSPVKIELSDLLPAVTNPINGSSVLFKRDVFLKAGGFDTKLIYSEDYDFYLNLLTKGYKFGYVDSVVSKYRIHEDRQTTNYNAGTRIDIRNYLIKKYKVY
jgi:teichuronic acid biosynthesis glycosyltransferase TuaG